MLKQDEMMQEALQSFETKETGDVVMSFFAIAEVSGVSLGDNTAYRIFSKGSPATVLGLAEYLGVKAREWLQERDDGHD